MLDIKLTKWNTMPPWAPDSCTLKVNTRRKMARHCWCKVPRSSGSSCSNSRRTTALNLKLISRRKPGLVYRKKSEMVALCKYFSLKAQMDKCQTRGRSQHHSRINSNTITFTIHHNSMLSLMEVALSLLLRQHLLCQAQCLLLGKQYQIISYSMLRCTRVEWEIVL